MYFFKNKSIIIDKLYKKHDKFLLYSLLIIIIFKFMKFYINIK